MELPRRRVGGEGAVVYAAVFGIVERVFERVFFTVGGDWESDSVLFRRRKGGIRGVSHRIVDEEGEERVVLRVANERGFRRRREESNTPSTATIRARGVCNERSVERSKHAVELHRAFNASAGSGHLLRRSFRFGLRRARHVGRGPVVLGPVGRFIVGEFFFAEDSFAIAILEKNIGKRSNQSRGKNLQVGSEASRFDVYEIVRASTTGRDTHGPSFDVYRSRKLQRFGW